MLVLVLRRSQTRESLRAPQRKAGEMQLPHIGRSGAQISSLLCQYLARRVRTSHRGSPAILLKLVGYARADNAEGIPTDKRSNGTCVTDMNRHSEITCHSDLTFRRPFP